MQEHAGGEVGGLGAKVKLKVFRAFLPCLGFLGCAVVAAAAAAGHMLQQAGGGSTGRAQGLGFWAGVLGLRYFEMSAGTDAHHCRGRLTLCCPGCRRAVTLAAARKSDY
jgi:hypothetical protein